MRAFRYKGYKTQGMLSMYNIGYMFILALDSNNAYCMVMFPDKGCDLT